MCPKILLCWPRKLMSSPRIMVTQNNRLWDIKGWNASNKLNIFISIVTYRKHWWKLRNSGIITLPQGFKYWPTPIQYSCHILDVERSCKYWYQYWLYFANILSVFLILLIWYAQYSNFGYHEPSAIPIPILRFITLL